MDESLATRSLYDLNELIALVRADLGLTDSSLLSDANITSWLNRAQDRLALVTRWYRVADTMGTTANQKEYALPATGTGRCIQIEEIRYDSRQLDVITLDQLRLWDYNYQQAGTGIPEWYYVRGHNGFGLHVTPSVTDADILDVLYVALPPPLESNDEFYVPHGGDEYILTYAKRLASEKDMYGEGARRVQLYEAQCAQMLKEIQRQVDQAAERVHPVLGGDVDEIPGGRSKVNWHQSISFP